MISYICTSCSLSVYTGVFGLYPCNSTAIQEDTRALEILTELTFSAYTRDKKFDPIVLYFYKECNSTSPKGDFYI